ncbi:MAG: class II aldolase/adducin family protein [Spirochaetales bacterium]|nr:class II aldolase/adducin family protein [Spirochaetales bacterium]
MSLEKLVEISNRYGSDLEYVIAGGGNTSWKNDEIMYVKGSGTELGTITGDGFVKVDLSRLDAIWSKSYSEDVDKREEEVLEDLMASRFPSEMKKRPSVETLLHALLPFSYVVHTHPALVNGITCSRQGKDAIDRLFGKKAIWVPVTNPGYILAKEVKDEIEKNTAGGNDFPQMIFLQNHGVFVSGNSEEEVDGIYKEIFDAIRPEVGSFPAGKEIPVEADSILAVESIVKSSLDDSLTVSGFANQDILDMARSEKDFAPLDLAFTPDHIVYYGFKPLYAQSLETLADGIAAYKEENGVNPRLAVIKDLGAFAFNSTATQNEKSRLLFLDDVKVAVYTASFGGYQFMPEDQINFIRNWEVEQYRASLSR